MATTKVLLTGAAGYIASQLLPTFRQRYDLTLVDVTQTNRQGDTIWSLANARKVLGYQPEDDSEVTYANDIRGFLVGDGAIGGVGRVGA